MDEEGIQKTKEDEKETTTDDSNERVQQKTISELDRADQIAERQKRENDRRSEILDREEALAARKAVGGIADAGQPAEKKEETPKEYRTRINKEMAEGKTEFGN